MPLSDGPLSDAGGTSLTGSGNFELQLEVDVSEPPARSQSRRSRSRGTGLLLEKNIVCELEPRLSLSLQGITESLQ